MRLLEVESTYPGNDEQGMLNDIGEIQLEESSVVSVIRLLCDGVLTLADCTVVSIPAIWASHSALFSFLPILHHGDQYSGSVNRESDNERGRKEIVGHIVSQVGNEDINFLRLHRLLEFFDKLTFGRHV